LLIFTSADIGGRGLRAFFSVASLLSSFLSVASTLVGAAFGVVSAEAGAAAFGGAVVDPAGFAAAGVSTAESAMVAVVDRLSGGVVTEKFRVAVTVTEELRTIGAAGKLRPSVAEKRRCVVATEAVERSTRVACAITLIEEYVAKLSIARDVGNLEMAGLVVRIERIALVVGL
jgi:hypothetical protein